MVKKRKLFFLYCTNFNSNLSFYPIVSDNVIQLHCMLKECILYSWTAGTVKWLAQWLRSLQPPNPEVPSSIPRRGRELNNWVAFFLAKVHSAFYPSGVGKMSTWFEEAAICACMCFLSTGGKLIIVKRLWECYMKKALYICTTLLYFTYFCLLTATFSLHVLKPPNSCPFETDLIKDLILVVVLLDIWFDLRVVTNPDFSRIFNRLWRDI